MSAVTPLPDPGPLPAPSVPPVTGRRVYIKTYGCQMNVHDSQRLGDVLFPLGYRETGDAETADLIILNTCHIREKAAAKLYSELGRLRRLKAGKRSVKIAVAGCVAQAEGEEIIARAPVVDLVVGPQVIHRLPQLLERQAMTGAPVVEMDFPVEDKFAGLDRLWRARALAPSVSAFVTVQEGCDKFCAFCVVPYTRGAEFSRPPERIIAEVERRVAAGTREVTLLGQNVNGYRGRSSGDGETWGLARLLEALSALNGLERLRYTTSHPCDMDEALIAAHGDNPKLMPYLHLPAQSGSDRILRAMNRRHDAAAYCRLIEKLRRRRPDMALSGDFIVGFPGESEQDFAQTLALVKTVGYAQAYSFKYSPRPGTPAADRGNHCPEEVKHERLLRLQALLEEQRRAFNAACVGRVLPVLLEKPGRHPGQLAGRSPYLQPVHMTAGDAGTGDLVAVHITAAGSHALTGEVRRIMSPARS